MKKKNHRYTLHAIRLVAAVGVMTLGLAPAGVRADDKSAYCSGMYYCLQEKPEGCTNDECLYQEDIRYTGRYCEIFKDLRARGLSGTTAWGKRIYKQVSSKYRVVYTLEGSLPMSAALLTYLMNNLPFSAQLINAYQGTNYRVAYMDRGGKHFRGDNGDNLSGSFTTVLQNPARSSTLYHGYGTTEVMMWRLSGTALVLFDFEPRAAQEVTYKLQCMVFPANGFVKSILNFIMFRKVILGVLDRTFRYVQESALAFYRGNREPLINYPAFATPEGRRQIEAFNLVVQQTMGKGNK